MEPIIFFGINQLEVIKLINRIHIEVYQNPTHSDFFSTWEAKLVYNSHTTIVAADLGGCQSTFHPLFAIVSLVKEVIKVVKAILFDEGTVLGDEAEFLGGHPH